MANVEDHGDEPNEHDLAGQNPVEVLRRALAISPKDAKQVREDAAKSAKPGQSAGSS
jgi:hypothetical protein